MIGGQYIGETYWGGLGSGRPSIEVDFQLLVSGRRLEGHLLEGSPFSITEELGTRSIFACALFDSTATLRISEGESLLVREGGRTIFGGTVERVQYSTDMKGRALWLSLEAVGYEQIADRRLVSRRYAVEGQTLGDVVRDLVSRYLAADGITDDYVIDGPELGVVAWNHVAVSQVFDELAELTGFYWYVDADRSLHFCDCGAELAPWAIGAALGSRHHRKMTLSGSRSDYRNRQVIVGGKEASDDELTERFKSDGEAKTWTVSRPIAAEPSVTFDGIEQSVGIKDVETGFSIYWNKGSDTITLDDDLEALAEGTVIEVQFRYEFPILVTADDPEAISERRAVEGGSGLYERVESGNTLDDGTLVLSRARGLLRKFAALAQTIEIETDRAGIQRGHVLRIADTALGIDGEYLVESVSSRNELGRFRLRHLIRAVSGEGVGGWSEYYRRAAKRGRPFSIGENDVLLVGTSTLDKVAVADAVSAATGNEVGPWEDDRYSVALVGPGIFGLGDIGEPQYPDA